MTNFILIILLLIAVTASVIVSVYLGTPDYTQTKEEQAEFNKTRDERLQVFTGLLFILLILFGGFVEL